MATRLPAHAQKRKRSKPEVVLALCYYDRQDRQVLSHGRRLSRVERSCPFGAWYAGADKRRLLADPNQPRPTPPAKPCARWLADGTPPAKPCARWSANVTPPAKTVRPCPLLRSMRPRKSLPKPKYRLKKSAKNRDSTPKIPKTSYRPKSYCTSNLRIRTKYGAIIQNGPNGLLKA